MVMGEEKGRKEAEPAVGKDVVKETVAQAVGGADDEGGRNKSTRNMNETLLILQWLRKL